MCHMTTKRRCSSGSVEVAVVGLCPVVIVDTAFWLSDASRQPYLCVRVDF